MVGCDSFPLSRQSIRRLRSLGGGDACVCPPSTIGWALPIFGSTFQVWKPDQRRKLQPSFFKVGSDGVEFGNSAHPFQAIRSSDVKNITKKIRSARQFKSSLSDPINKSGLLKFGQNFLSLFKLVLVGCVRKAKYFSLYAFNAIKILANIERTTNY